MTRKKVGVLSRLRPEEVHSWQKDRRRRHGFTLFSMVRSLERFYDVELVQCSLDPSAQVLHFLDRARHRLLSAGRFACHHTFLYSANAGRAIARRLRGSSYDVLFTSKGSTEIAFLETDIPLVYESDSTFDLNRDYYHAFTGLKSRNLAQGDEIERRALENAGRVILTSDWAKDSARRHYGVAESKISVIPLGADLVDVPAPQDLSYERSAPPCELLFVGLDWEEKGGEIAFRAMKLLNEGGLDTRLTVVGCSPPPVFRDPDMTVIPFLDKGREADWKRFSLLMSKADFFICPSRAEAFGIVFSEASAFALPSLTADTGGTALAVRNGVNGKRLPPDDGGEGYAEAIRAIWDDKSRYEELRRSSRRRYEEELNWGVWGEKTRDVIDSLL